MVEQIISSKFIWQVKTPKREEEITANNWEEFEERFWKLFDEIQYSGEAKKEKENE